jgi:hypothetical protein
MNNSELDTFKRMFKDYYDYIKGNDRSLLARIYGIFTVFLEDIDPVHLILMANTIRVKSKEKKAIDCLFDLKGSLVGRLTKDTDPNSTPILKDLNIRLKRKHKLVFFSLFIIIVLAIRRGREKSHLRITQERH